MKTPRNVPHPARAIAGHGVVGAYVREAKQSSTGIRKVKVP
jgi:hypothetical protein